MSHLTCQQFGAVSQRKLIMPGLKLLVESISSKVHMHTVCKSFSSSSIEIEAHHSFHPYHPQEVRNNYFLTCFLKPPKQMWLLWESSDVSKKRPRPCLLVFTSLTHILHVSCRVGIKEMFVRTFWGLTRSLRLVKKNNVNI